jgi:hypothetical protein
VYLCRPQPLIQQPLAHSASILWHPDMQTEGFVNQRLGLNTRTDGERNGERQTYVDNRRALKQTGIYLCRSASLSLSLSVSLCLFFQHEHPQSLKMSSMRRCCWNLPPASAKTCDFWSGKLPKKPRTESPCSTFKLATPCCRIL